ncbi:hypothetical protein NE237_003960 [Protea cynaroides]|uniref:(+)-neomenthol dehydrogenase-like n=1 Tax=Protea cynaroides TaxID=273540 RepID=A0A9Q0KIE9_9MAGN|nr:hypothetical protein NE237_003960 [Protea cynaroides]
MFKSNPTRCTVVTGANKGIGLEICRQLASNGVAVVLTARDEKRGVEAVEKLKESGLSDVIFHQLDGKEPASIASLAHFIKTQLGKLDILVNNAAVSGIILDDDAYGALMAMDGSNSFCSISISSHHRKCETPTQILHQRDWRLLQEPIRDLDCRRVATASIASLAHFIKTQFGKLDILVNNAAVSGIVFDDDVYGAIMAVDGSLEVREAKFRQLAKQTYETGEDLLPALQLSDLSRIVNVSSSAGKLQNISHTWAKEVLSDIDGLTEERVDEALNKLRKDFMEGLIVTKGWPAYSMSKAALNAYTRTLSKKFPEFRVNCVCPSNAKVILATTQGSLQLKKEQLVP